MNNIYFITLVDKASIYKTINLQKSLYPETLHIIDTYDYELKNLSKIYKTYEYIKNQNNIKNDDIVCIIDGHDTLFNRKLYKIYNIENSNSVFYFIDNIFKNTTELYNYKQQIQLDITNSILNEKNNKNTKNKKMSLINLKSSKNIKILKNKKIKPFKTFNFVTIPIELTDSIRNISRTDEEIMNDVISEFITKTINYAIDYIEMCNRMERLTL
jgi:hypothetical protein